MAEGDYGLSLPITISGTTLSTSDTIMLTFKDKQNGSTILVKDLTPTDNAVTLNLTEAESALFPVGVYVYALDWYQLGNFMCNIVPVGIFKVVDKA